MFLFYYESANSGLPDHEFRYELIKDSGQNWFLRNMQREKNYISGEKLNKLIGFGINQMPISNYNKEKRRMGDRLSILLKRYSELKCCEKDIHDAFEILCETYTHNGKLLVCGNGGSCADSEHIVGELMKSFCKKRSIPQKVANNLRKINPKEGDKMVEMLECGLPAIALSAHTALNTAFANDKNGELMYAQQVMGYGNDGDAFIGISTSGNSKNVVYAMQVAKAKGLKTIALTGKDGGKIAQIADVAIIVPSNETYQIQELHLPVYHTLCLMLEDTFFEK